MIGDHDAVDLLGRVGRPPVNDPDGQTGVRGDIPQRVALPIGAQKQVISVLRVGPGKGDDPVLVRGLAGRDRVPDTGRQKRGDRPQRCEDAGFRQPGQVRQRAFLLQGPGQAVAGPVDPHQEHTGSRRLFSGTATGQGCEQCEEERDQARDSAPVEPPMGKGDGLCESSPEAHGGLQPTIGGYRSRCGSPDDRRSGEPARDASWREGRPPVVGDRGGGG